MSVVHWITYNFCYFFLLVALFTQFILDNLHTGSLNQVKQSKSYFINLWLLLTLPHSYLSRTRLTSSTDASVRWPLLTYFPFKCLPILPLLPISNGSWTYFIIRCITGASKPNKQLYQNYRLQHTYPITVSDNLTEGLLSGETHLCTWLILFQGWFALQDLI